MEILPFQFDQHAPIIQSWLMSWGKKTVSIDDLPEIGFIAFEADYPLAAGFIRRLEKCSVAMIDGLIANPFSFGKARHRAINDVVENIIEKSKELGIERLFANSIDSSTLKRSKLFGFVELPHITISLDLSKKEKVA